ncbi:MAG: hypothetical protein ACJAVK_000597, partial [Akkermansiaceae bacterium]
EEGLAVEPESPSLGKGRLKRRGIKMEARVKVAERQGKMRPREALRKRVASFTTGVAIGGEDFVKAMAKRYQNDSGRKKSRIPQAVTEGKDGFFVMKE